METMELTVSVVLMFAIAKPVMLVDTCSIAEPRSGQLGLDIRCGGMAKRHPKAPTRRKSGVIKHKVDRSNDLLPRLKRKRGRERPMNRKGGVLSQESQTILPTAWSRLGRPMEETWPGTNCNIKARIKPAWSNAASI